jgi:inosine-uridine nucleoside N-ribohydrolase
MPSEKIIFDCDNTMGLPLKDVDDGLTLLYLLGRPDLDLLGITTTFGNGTIEQVYPQTHQLAEKLNLDIPVFKGEGSRGQGPNTDAASFLAETVRQYPGEITLLATGPLGNLAAAAQLDICFYRKLKRVVVMGGYTEPMKLGYRYLDELNFSANPEAALSVLQAPCPVTVLSGQACLDAPFTMRRINRADWWPAPLKWLLRGWLMAFGVFCGVTKFYLWDLVPAVYLSHPDLFENHVSSINLSIKSLEKGLLFPAEHGQGTSIHLPVGILDQDRFYQRLETAWRRSAELFPVSNIF